jgi:Alginate lyase.
MSGAASTPAFADMTCVQTELARLGFDPGPADGLIGRRTRNAAAEFVSSSAVSLPDLSNQTAATWCQALRDAPSPPIDVASPPKDVLSGNDLERLWTSYQRTNECMQHNNIGASLPLTLTRRSAEQFAATTWHSPFTPVRGAPQCALDAGGLVPPAPIPVVKLDERYGERVSEVDMATEWFARIATYVRLTDDPVARAVLKRGVLDWAQAGSLTQGVRISRDDHPIDFQMMQAILTVLNATAEIAGDFDPAERGIVGLWLQDIVGQVAESRWRFRQDNKMFLRTYVTMIWGLMTYDELAIRQAVDVYKQGIHEMRPDGSWPIDSQRGGMGLHYGARSASSLGLIAMALKSARDIDLFSYEVDGRSIHTAVEFAVAAMQDPGGVNQKYALACPGGGDRFGTIQDPDLYLFEDGAFFSAYAAYFPEREASKYLQEAYPLSKQVDFELAGGRASCQFALTGGSVSLPALEMPDLAATWPVPEHVVRTHEEISGTTGRDKRLDVLWFSEVAGQRNDGDPIRYNVMGDYDAAGNKFTGFRISTKAVLDSATLARLTACGGKTDFYDDAHHPLIEFTPGEGSYLARGVECVIGALSDRDAWDIAFLMDHFQDVALGWASTGALAQIKHEGLRDLMLAVAKGEVVVGRSNQAASTAEWPASTYTVVTREEVSETSGQDQKLDVLWFSEVIGVRDGNDPLRYNLLGQYAPTMQEFLSLRIATKAIIDEEVANALLRCGVRTDFYDDAHHPVLEFRIGRDTLKPLVLDCVLGALPERAAFEIAFLVDNFRDVALGWARTGDIVQIKHEGLRDLMLAIAKGEITVSR